ncbi:MAG TPA: glycyl-radical enzyme activating protein [Candidatus Lokiarchaeia archaeon]|nr:glycyl-radical enzyme activating protein [Candidatus Lokiarchaeia archaeon]
MSEGTIARAEQACITDIQKFSVHDGPGIRTTVFFKGCPLDCAWCQNPECINPAPQIGYRKSRCVKCKKCVNACPEHAIKSPGKIDTTKCKAGSGCRACETACDAGALEIAGKTMTVDELLRVVLEDKDYYDQSGGGVTVSGGEPTYQWPFVKKFLEACRNDGISTAIETCGFFNPAIINEIITTCDVILFDLKHLDPATHEKLTGQPNTTILSNLATLHDRVKSMEGKQFFVRTPLVPGLNDSKEHMLAIEAFLFDHGITALVLLPYHSLYLEKIDEFSLKRKKLTIKPHTKEDLERIQQYFTRISVSFGG